MQKSKSILSFGSASEQNKVIHKSRSQSRSSLDTFVIPGRTRLPSSKMSTSTQNPADLRIVQNLLSHGVMTRAKQAPIRSVPSNSDNGGNDYRSDRVPRSRSGSGRHTIAPPTVPSRIKNSPTIQSPSPITTKRVNVSSLHRHTEPDIDRTTPHLSLTENTVDPDHCQTDGPDDADDSGRVSRMTSTTWSTVSHRVFSDSSDSSRISKASEFRLEYNTLAEKHGFSLLTGEYHGSILPQIQRLSLMLADVSEGTSETKVTQKYHKTWLARKLFRRSASTYTLKAKTTFKPVSRKKSLGGIRLLADHSPTNVLTGRSLEEVCRLGGLGVLVLPSDFAPDKLTLPMSLSASAAYILEYGTRAFPS